MHTSVYPQFVLEQPAGSVKRLELPNYPLTEIKYPVDYGSLPEFIGEDDNDLDCFKGSLQGGNAGMLRVWRPDVTGNVETKFFIDCSLKEIAELLYVFHSVICEPIQTFPTQYDFVFALLRFRKQ
jgi:hypothetical protein